MLPDNLTNRIRYAFHRYVDETSIQTYDEWRRFCFHCGYGLDYLIKMYPILTWW